MPRQAARGPLRRTQIGGCVGHGSTTYGHSTAGMGPARLAVSSLASKCLRTTTPDLILEPLNDLTVSPHS
jgi:hypothetical protein